MTEAPFLPKFDYQLDESDPEVVVLRRQDGSFVAAFSVGRTTKEGSVGRTTKEGIVGAAEEDYRALLWAHASSLGQPTEPYRSA